MNKKKIIIISIIIAIIVIITLMIMLGFDVFNNKKQNIDDGNHDDNKNQEDAYEISIYGGKNIDIFNGVVATKDGYVAIGYSDPIDAPEDEYSSNHYGTIVKYDLNNKVIWNKNHGEDGQNEFNGIATTKDGYIVAGVTNFGLTNEFDYDAILVKYDESGNIIWQKSYTGNTYTSYSSVISTIDGYIAVGKKHIIKKELYECIGDEEGDNCQYFDYGVDEALIVKYDLNGNIVWEKAFKSEIDGGSEFKSVAMLKNSYIAVGVTGINPEEPYDDTNQQAIAIEYNFNGTNVSNRYYGSGWNFKSFGSVIPITDGFIVAGYGYKDEVKMVGIIAKCDSYSNIKWKDYFSSNHNYENEKSSYGDWFYGVTSNTDSYIAVGGTNDAGIHSAITAKYDLNGEILSEKKYDFDSNDGFVGVASNDKGYASVGGISVYEHSKNYNRYKPLSKGEIDGIIVSFKQ
jgi:hypothetical protein